MSDKFFIGVDVGTQSSKVAIFNQKGKLICEATEHFGPLSYPKPGYVEHPDDELWDTLKIACQEVMNKFTSKGLNSSDILSMGICIVRSCRALLKKDGTLANPIINWMDTRLASPYQHDIDDVAYICSTTGYITHRLTGEFKDTSAYYDMYTQWPLDQNTFNWSTDDEVIKKYNIPREMLFELVQPAEILGYVTDNAANKTGLPKGLPVVATANDKAVEGLGSGIYGNSKDILISLGTYITSMMAGSEQQGAKDGFWTNLASVPNEYIYESAGIRRGMWTVSWFKEQFGETIAKEAAGVGVSIEDYLSMEAKDIAAGSDGLLTIHEWLAPWDKPYRRGSIIGFDSRHTRSHMWRSLLEGIAFTMKAKTDLMCKELGFQPDRIIISGGGSNSSLIMQIFADVYGVVTCRNQINSAASLGAAIDAAIAVKQYSSFDEAIANMVHVRDEFQPNMSNTGIYQRILSEAYVNANDYIDGLLKRIHNITN